MNVYITPNAQKELDTIFQKEKQKIIKKLRQLEVSPLSGKRLSGKLRGFYSIRAWPYRIIYELLKNDVWIAHIMHRKDAYKN